jgi:transposase
MSNFTLSLGIDSLEITAQSIDNKGNIIFDVKGNIIFDVKSRKTDTPCRICGKLINKQHGYGEVLTVQHLSILDQPVYLRIRVVRYQCLDCDNHPTTSKSYDWMERKSKTTRALDTYMNRQLIHSTVEDVSKKEKISYDVVESDLNREVKKTVDWSEYKDLTTLGIDEIALRKGQNDYVTIISTKTKEDALSVIAVLPDRRKETVKTFLDSIPDSLKKTVKSVCTDMCDSFVQSASEVFGSRVVVIDRYHVAKLYRDPLDQLRIKEMKRLKSELSQEEYAQLENIMWILRKKHECLSKDERQQLDRLYKHSPELKEMHRLALKLTTIFNTHHSRKTAFTKMNRWIESVEKSELSGFGSFIRTLKKYKVTILNYFKERKNRGFVEGLNNKIKVIKRRCYGLYKTESIFQRLFLDLKGYQVFA